MISQPYFHFMGKCFEASDGMKKLRMVRFALRENAAEAVLPSAGISENM